MNSIKNKVDKELVYTTGELSRIFCVGISVQLLTDLEIEPAARLANGLAVYWWKKDFPLIKYELANHILGMDES